MVYYKYTNVQGGFLMVETVLKIAAISGTFLFIFFMFMVLGFIPSERICKFLREHEVVQFVLLIMGILWLLPIAIR